MKALPQRTAVKMKGAKSGQCLTHTNLTQCYQSCIYTSQHPSIGML